MNRAYRFKVGNFDCVVLADFVHQSAVERIFSEVPEAERRAGFSAAGLDPNLKEVDTACTCLAVHNGQQWTLIDTGFGKLTEAEGYGELFANMAAAGLKPEDFRAVILSHLHADHYIGLADENHRLIYPNAKIYVWEAEWQHWTTPETLTPIDKEFPEQREAIRDYLLPLQAHVELVKQEGELFPGIRLIYAPGHTAHNIVIAIESAGECLVHIGDVYQHPLFITYPRWPSMGTYNPDQLVETRQNLAKLAAERNYLVQACHFPFPGLGHIRPDGDTWQWEPITTN